jgi:hypothetical protein
MNPTHLKVQCKVHFTHCRHGRKQMTVGDGPAAAPVPLGRVPRLARLMALALRFEGLIARGEVRDYAALARLGHVTRARVTQIMNLLNLAPDIQEALLFLPPIEAGRDPIKEWQVRPLAAQWDWKVQRRSWQRLASAGRPPDNPASWPR